MTRSSFLFLPLVPFLVSLAAGCERDKGESAAARPAAAAKVEPAAAEPEEQGELSDLDRSVEELKAEKCEHGIPTYQCAECRYEMGMVPAPPGTQLGGGDGALVATARVESRQIPPTVEVAGEVAEAGDRTAHVAARTSGVIHGTPARLGQIVAPGDVLAEIDSREVAEAKSASLLRRAALSVASRTLSRERSLSGQGVSAGQDRLAAQAAYNLAELDLADARTRLFMLGLEEAEIDALSEDDLGPDAGHIALHASLPGTVMWVDAALGETVEEGTELFVVSDLTVVWVWVDVAGDDIGRILASPPGTKLSAQITSRSLPGLEFRGEIATDGAVVDEETRTLRMPATVPNPERRLRPGMFVQVTIELPAQPPTAMVPEEAVLRDEGRDFVFVLLPDRYFVRRPVTVGRDRDGWAEILAGLEPGAEVAAHGAFLLKSDVLRSKMGAGCAD
jgi:cobalt-zinc-cadmium efflux system membrane fusion protein